MDLLPSSNTRVSTKKEPFGNIMLNILKATNFGSVSYYADPKQLNELNALESYDDMESFIDWFTNNVTEENCVTMEELESYHHLKMTGKLVPDEDLDALIASFCAEATPSADLEPAIELARKELQALDSLEKFLLKHDKLEGKKKSFPVITEVDFAISKELNELCGLNTQFNEALEKFASSWMDLRTSYTQRQMESKELPDDFLIKLNNINKEINENIHNSLENDFKEVGLLQGVLNVTPKDYWLIYNRIMEIQRDLIKTECRREATSLFYEGLNKLEYNLNNNITFSINQIRDVVYSSTVQSELIDVLSDRLKKEKDCLNEIQALDSEKSVSFLTDRLAHLTKIENILRKRWCYYQAVFLISKGEKVARDFQLEKLLEFYHMIESYIQKYEERMNFMINYKQQKKNFVTQTYKKMMNDLNVKDMDLVTLDKEISCLHKRISEAYEEMNKQIMSFLNETLKKYEENKEISNFFFNGPTREAFTHIIDDFIEPLEILQKDLLSIEKKTNKINSMFKDLVINEHEMKKDCIWLKCLNNPEEFIHTFQEMKIELESYKAKNEKLIKFN